MEKKEKNMHPCQTVFLLLFIYIANGLWPQRIKFSNNRHKIWGSKEKKIGECFHMILDTSDYNIDWYYKQYHQVTCMGKDAVRWEAFEDMECQPNGNTHYIGDGKQGVHIPKVVSTFFSKNGEFGYTPWKDKFGDDSDFNCNDEGLAIGLIIGGVIIFIIIIVGIVYYIKKKKNIPKDAQHHPDSSVYGQKNCQQQIPMHSYVNQPQQNVPQHHIRQSMNQSLTPGNPITRDIALNMLSNGNQNTPQNHGTSGVRRQTGEL